MRQIKCLLLLTFIVSTVFAGNRADTTKPVTSPRSAKDSNVLIVVDGKIVGFNKEFPSIDNIISPDSIESVNVWKGKDATDRYGEKAHDGVIEIYTKRKIAVKVTETQLSDITDKDEDRIFNQVEVEAAFPGGDKAWRNYLERSLNANVPVDYGAPAGVYTIIVQFVVSKDGSISDVKALTNHGYGMEKEVVRVIKLGPKWLPAIQDGRQVKAYRKQPVTFMVIEEGKKKKKNRD